MQSLAFELKPSFIYCALILSLSLGAFVVLSLLSLSYLIFLVVLGISVYLVSDSLLKNPRTLIYFKLQDDNTWQVRSKTQQFSALLVKSQVVVSPWAIFLVFKVPNKILKRHVVIFKDTLSLDEFRRLSLWLNMR